MTLTPVQIAEVDAIENDHPSKAVLEAYSTEKVLSQGLTANCSNRYTATKSSGNRPLSEIKWVVMHSTEGGTAQGAAAWFANPRSQGSAHLCVDDNICYKTLDDQKIPWGASGANYHGYHIELAGFARWTSLIWSTTHRRTLERGAYKAALRCRWYGIPRVFRTAQELNQGLAGVTTHNECSGAFGGSHWDPGFGWPRSYFMGRVRYWYARLWHEELRA
jgi:hypothetical protein